MPKIQTTLETALAYHAAGLSVIPVKSDGTKAPAVRWQSYQDSIAEEPELRKWFDNGQKLGIGVVGGKVSGNLETIDFDHNAAEVFPNWRKLVEAEAPGLGARLSVRQTPGGGYHASYRCTEIAIPSNTKIAMTADGKNALIESRGEGGQVLVPGCPRQCHPSRKMYLHHSGPKLEKVETITAAEREIVWRCARSFDQTQQEPKPAGVSDRDDSPGSDYNRHGPDWREILSPHGWQCVRECGAVRYWRRPGKAGPGWSATTGRCTSKNGWELLAVFSSEAAPFEGPKDGKPCTCYSKFAAHALLHHGGDFKAAAKALAEIGYGKAKGSAAALTIYTASDLHKMELAEPQCIVPGIVPEGLTLLAGKPKLGKSWRLLLIAIAVASGGTVLGRTVERAPVLYLALEDNRRRLQSRLRMLVKGDPMPELLHLATSWPRQDKGGVAASPDF